MSFIKQTIIQIKALFPVYFISYTVLIVLLFSITMISVYYHIPGKYFTRDPISLFNGYPFIGVISNIGILFWCSTSAICLFSSAIHSQRKHTEVSVFLFFSGLLTLLLLLDDLFMFHDTIFPHYLFIPKIAVYLGYLLLMTIYFIKFGKLILTTEYTILYIACGFFALSMICDVFWVQNSMEFLVEDGFKLFGIVTWFIFFIRTCFTEVLYTANKGSDL